MIHIDQAIIVEGKYDKIKLSSVTDAVIIVTNGFGLFKDKEKQALIRFYAAKTGIVILTDSDTAGFRIRSLVKNIAAGGKIINVYVPEIFGKEKRKARPSREGKLGVEGIDPQVIKAAFEKAGISSCEREIKEPVTMLDLYEDGLSGGPFSAALRQQLLEQLELPHLLTSKAMLEAINAMMSREEYMQLVSRLIKD